MCLLLIAIDATPEFPLLLLGNRDEFHARASTPVQAWTEDARVVGGRDLVAGGSWLALREDGRFAAITNVRTGVPATAPRSRGWLVRDFMLGDAQPAAFLDALRSDPSDYGPFNLVVGDRTGVCTLGSADRDVCWLRAGVHVISNGPIGVHWPKTERLRRRFVETCAAGLGADAETRLLDLLVDEAQPLDESLPDTGTGLDLERRLAPIFIRGEKYGTRAGTLAEGLADGSWVMRERRFGPNGSSAGETRWQALPRRGFTTSISLPSRSR